MGPRDTVNDVLSKFTGPHVHRLFVCDDAFRPVAVWSLSDVIDVFLRYKGVAKKEKAKKKKSNDKKGKK